MVTRIVHHHHFGPQGYHPAATVMQFITTITNLLELLLGVRFVLRLLGANPANGFSVFIYKLSDVFLDPFRNMFPRTILNDGVIEWSTLMAMLMYAIAAFAVVQLIAILIQGVTDDTDDDL